MDTRRDFLKKAALLSGATGVWSVLPTSIQAALAIEPEPGSTFLDAEHVVILMQENRSFDHTFGTLQGVRGFNDPRAIKLGNKNPVWLQSNKAGETYAPFRLNIKDTNATWMGSLPHSWPNQVDARNHGRNDGWLEAKRPGREYAKMPLTMGYYNREDIPFYYALADAFTVCDQNFCSSLTGTTPNRLYLWTGTIREKHDASVPAMVRNSEVDYGEEASWTTFPERLEDHGISWKIYQNELSLPAGFEGQEEDWLANFTDNPIEWFTQYQVRFGTGYQGYLAKRLKSLPGEIAEAEKQAQAATAGSADAEKLKKRLAELTNLQKQLQSDQERWNPENYAKLSQRQKNLHEKAFCTNTGDPHYHELTTLTYQDEGKERQIQAPKGDVFHQFREDVKNGKLPTVSWLVSPAAFSDHPGSPWFGAWYVSEALEILTQNPEVWKKTIFILCYDENDGYFDHISPFAPPHPNKPETGKVSTGIDVGEEYVLMEQERKRYNAREARESPIGLGFRVPLVIASPWSRGGYVCSQVFDHTSPLQLLEKLLSHKTGKKVEEPNITPWRRTVCGDLTSAFRPYHGEKIASPTFLERDEFIEEIHKASFKKLPDGYKALTAAEIEQARKDPAAPALTQQEKGIRPSCALPYQLHAEGGLNSEKSHFTVRMEAQKEAFGEKAAGSPFNLFSYGDPQGVAVRHYAVKAGDTLTDSIPLGTGGYHLELHGPNGFMREFSGNQQDPAIEVQLGYSRASGGKKGLSGGLELQVINRDTREQTIEVSDLGYGGAPQKQTLRAGSRRTFRVSTSSSHGWYDLGIRVAGAETFGRRYAGRVETGTESFSDPVMGHVKA